MKIAMLSMYDDRFKEISDIITPGKEEYCKRWGYDAFFGSPFMHSNPADPYERMRYTYELLADGYDTVMWIDGDAMITNHQISIEERLGNARFMIAADLLGLNTGVFIATNHSKVKQLLFTIYNFRHTTRHLPFPEQDALSKLLFFPPYADLATIVPQRTMNSYLNELYGRPPWFDGTWHEGDWILHFPGLSNEQRKDLAQEYSLRVVR